MFGIYSLEKSWQELLSNEFSKEYFLELKRFLIQEKNNYTIYPAEKEVFSAFQFTPFSETKVVILGQDPYHGAGQAHGLSFSVKKEVKIPPSLRNIFKEIHFDLGEEIPNSGNLEQWAKQGVLLLNATLTVRANKAASHQKKGWETFTDKIIATLSEKRENLVFLLWGNYAQAKVNLINSQKHLVLTAAHPSPLSAYNGFFGCKHFSKTNDFLFSKNIKPIYWKINDAGLF
jgi:uracil-DNA glycosylase